MNENPEGTPNPLNPAPSTGEELAAGTGPLDFVETANVSEEVEEPKMADTPEADTPEISEVEETAEVTEVSEPVSNSEPIKPASFTEAAGSIEAEEINPVETIESIEPIEPTEPTELDEPAEPLRANNDVADPMMRPVSHNNFDTLGMNNTSSEEEPVDDLLVEETIIAETPSPLTTAPINDAPELVAKDSIVEPVGGDSRKKILIVGAMILLMIAIICGVAAAAIMFVGNGNDDRVTKAIEKLLNGETSSIVAVQGNIDAVPNTDDSTAGSFNLDFNGTFDTKSSMNTVSAKINTEISSGNKVSISIDELENEDGDIFFKVRGLDSLLGGSTTANSESLKKCVDSTDSVKCLDTAGNVTVTDLISVYGGLVEVINNQWILTSDSFSDTMEDLGMFDNGSACLVNALGSLPEYGKDIAKKYKANQFITYSTDKLEISKKKNALYRIGFDDQKLTAFINSLSGNEFMNELNACVGNTATNTDAAEETVSDIFDTMPTIYVEVDDNDNFTRVYFRANTNWSVYDDGSSDNCQCVMAPCNCSAGFYETPMAVTADLNLTYPNKLEINEPDDYIDMSDLVNKLMGNIFSDESN